MCVFWELLLSLIIITVRFLDDSSMCYVCFPHEEVGKESACSTGELGLIPALGRSPGGGHGNPLQYSCLENPHGQKSLAGYSPWGR